MSAGLTDSTSGELVAVVTPETTPAELIAALIVGRDDAWREVVRRYSARIRITIQSFRLNEADGKDAMQTTWTKLLENVATIKNPNGLGCWLTTTAARECVKITRRVRQESPIWGPTLDERASEDSPESAVVDEGFNDWLWNLVDETVSPRQNRVLRALLIL